MRIDTRCDLKNIFLKKYLPSLHWGPSLHPLELKSWPELALHSLDHQPVFLRVILVRLEWVMVRGRQHVHASKNILEQERLRVFVLIRKL